MRKKVAYWKLPGIRKKLTWLLLEKTLIFISLVPFFFLLPMLLSSDLFYFVLSNYLLWVNYYRQYNHYIHIVTSAVVLETLCVPLYWAIYIRGSYLKYPPNRFDTFLVFLAGATAPMHPTLFFHAWFYGNYGVDNVFFLMINLSITLLLTLSYFTFAKIDPTSQITNTIILSYTFFSEWPKAYVGTIFFIIKLTISWFIIVWLRLNLFRYRFDQVASYTWHELVILAVFFLVSVLILQYIF